MAQQMPSKEEIKRRYDEGLTGYDSARYLLMSEYKMSEAAADNLLVSYKKPAEITKR